MSSMVYWIWLAEKHIAAGRRRELFERFYPGQAEMVVDFWMPNKTWAGCDVTDPTARVHTNYRDSGK